MNKIVERILHSLVHRSAIMIDVRNLILKENFDISDRELSAVCNEFRLQVLKMTCSVPLKMIGDRRIDGSYPIYSQTNFNSLNVISIGVGNNMIFDEGMASLGAHVHCFDHTVSPKIKKKFMHRIKHHALGVKGYNEEANCIRLSEIYDLSSNLNRSQKTFLKIDCEGAEYDVFNESKSELLSRFDQICIELHDLNKISIYNFEDKYLKILKKLEKDFVITYIVANNFTPIVKLKNGMLWPFTLEMHLYNRKNLPDLEEKLIKIGFPNELSKAASNWRLAPTYNLFEWYFLK